jgi:hypothetical protein
MCGLAKVKLETRQRARKRLFLKLLALPDDENTARDVGDV